MLSRNSTKCSIQSNDFDKTGTDKDEAIVNISIPQSFLDESSFLENESALSGINSTLDWTEPSPDDFSINSFIKSSGVYDADLNDQINNFKRLYQEMNFARMKYNRSQFVVNAMNELFNMSFVLPNDLKEKCSDEMRQKQFKNVFDNNRHVMHLFSNDISEGEALNSKEINMVRTAMNKSLCIKSLQLKSENEIVSDVLGSQFDSIYLPGSLLTQEEAVIFNRLEKLANIVNACSENAGTVKNFIEEIYDFRITKVQESQKLKFSGWESKTKLIYLQIKNLNFMIENAIVDEYENIAEAINLLFKELQAFLATEEYFLQNNRTLKENYDKVRETSKFDEILYQYKLLRDNLKHKHWAMKQLKS